ncbi:PadR family transcriptional regulator [Candidatus Enterococcus clewellii]|uniref:Transcription regulator PadR N-terminal domain-containing protein n=1 Tax=Candidatus Enterococcus clewellii TaxID=1834193 RepID=A0A242KC55_9ENTE|nr:PadR family transcriptional regulator [Enterococcus sp. 9E7_DIV0242]OTP18546.1 hypothetical protein A5888_000360 [Enterococcus sp. 9E7_DIV0242]
MKQSQNSMTETTFLILLSLVKEKHGYGVIKEIEERTQGRVTIAAGTLYTAFDILKKKQWIEETSKSEGRRKNYRLTLAGKNALKEERRRLEENLHLYDQIIGGN